MLHKSNRKKDLKKSLQYIYGNNGRPAGSVRSKLHNINNHTVTDHGNRALGARSSDQGTPWKLRHRQFFRMSNDGAQGTIRH